MADTGPATFWTQANALLRKNLTFQKRNIWSNIRLVAIPGFILLLLFAVQRLVESMSDKSDGWCPTGSSVEHQGAFCAIRRPPKKAPLLWIPPTVDRAIRTDFLPSKDLPSESCRRTDSCAATTLMTGNNRTFGQILAGSMYGGPFRANSTVILRSLAEAVVGSPAEVYSSSDYDPDTETREDYLYSLQRRCAPGSTFLLSIGQRPIRGRKEVGCTQGLYLWRNSSDEVNNELYKGSPQGDSATQTNKFMAAFDFWDSSRNKYNAHIWYDATFRNESRHKSTQMLRIPRLVNLVSNAYLGFLQGPDTRILFDYVKEMPQRFFKRNLDIASLLSPLFYTWVLLLLFPVTLNSLVYEKQQRLRIMMKMHGLGNGPYWMISYGYFLLISVIYLICFMVFGSAIGLNFFLQNDYSVQFVFYFIYLNLQISMAFLVASMFSNARTATGMVSRFDSIKVARKVLQYFTGNNQSSAPLLNCIIIVVAYLGVFGSGFLGKLFFQPFLEADSFPSSWVILMELYPGFSLYRGLYELSEATFTASYSGTDGMRWTNLSDGGMNEVFVIMIIEWVVVLFLAYYVDQLVSSGKSPLFFVHNLLKKLSSAHLNGPSLQRQGSNVLVEVEKTDVRQEREKVEQLLLEPHMSHAVVCKDLKKVYPGIDGNPPKFAVRGLFLALPTGECFGMLGPNGAGKTSFINMMIGLTKPTSGTAFIQGLNIRTDMDRIYTSMGVCPQHDLLWETLTGREHLLFYGRLKNLKSDALKEAVEESLRSVNLFHGGVADKQAGKYSGGMKRRLSVAISLIGNPKVVYMDEPSTGLDPASRKSLWNIVKRAKQDTAIILTTHSMEEAEVLCDRLGIFVNGSLQCIGNPKELKARYGGSCVLTMTTPAENEQEVEAMVQRLSPNAKKVYHISGTQKFELPKQEVRISDVLHAVQRAKRRFTVFAWGVADPTLEDVFDKVARAAQASQ